MYHREMIYMGLHKDGSRVGSAGFLKAEKTDKTSSLTMTVKNIPSSIEGRFPVRYCLGVINSGQMAESGETDAAGQSEQMEQMEWREEDGIMLRDGGGVWEKKELEASECIYVQILLPNGYLVEGKSKAALRRTLPKKKAQTEPAAADLRESAPAQSGIPAAVPYETGPAPVQGDIPAATRESVLVQRDISAAAPRESVPAQSSIPAAESVVIASREPAPARRGISAAVPRESAPVQGGMPAAPQAFTPGRPPLMADALAIEGLKEDKWEQILDTYDQIHPYGDDRIYVKIAPKDFIILSGSCQHLVNNSFLLHGFYNYRYVILGKIGEGAYYLGVPGAFYEREKMVALMFGFEAFECEGGDPKPGDFGYYLRKVEL